MLRSLGGATERSLGARWLLISVSLPLPPDFRPSFLLQFEPLLPVDRVEETVIIISATYRHMMFFLIKPD